MAECNRCGKCCFYPTGKTENGKIKLRACVGLVVVGNDRYICRYYKNRLGRKIGTDSNGNVYHCVMYNSLDKEIYGCPLNKHDGKPLVSISIDTRNKKEAIRL